MSMIDFINRMLGKENTNSKSIATDRLRLVLIHDRANISPNILNALKEDLIKVISEYMEIDQDALEVNLDQQDNAVALVANIPVLKMKRNYASSAT